MKRRYQRAFPLAVCTTLVGLVAMAPDVHADDAPCRATLAPSALSQRDTGLDRNRVACGVDGMSIGTRAHATIDTPNFYGTLTASLFLDYQWLHTSGFEFSLGARLIDYRFAQSAVFTEGDFALGPISVGVLRPRRTRWWGQPVVSSHAMRLEIPGTNSSDESLAVAASPQLLVTMMPSSRLHLHGRLAALLWSVLPESGADSRAAVLASADVAHTPLSRIAVTAGLEAQAGWYGLGLDHIQVRGGWRFRIGEAGALELSAASALAGAERSDLVFWLGYRKIAVPKSKPGRSRLQDWAR